MFNLARLKRQPKILLNLVPGIQETPYPTKSPTAYGREYLQKFNDYLQGNLSAKDIIDIKNVLLTKRPLNKKGSPSKKQVNVYPPLRTIQITKQKEELFGNLQFVKEDKSKQDETKEDQHAELESFVQNYNKGTEKRKSFSTANIPSSRLGRSGKTIILPKKLENDDSPTKVVKQFQKIKNFIEMRVSHKKSLNVQDNQTSNFKLLQNFQFIADDYIEKIKNNDLFSSDTTKKFYEHSGPKVHTRLNHFSLIKFKNKSTHDMNKNSVQCYSPPITKQTFRDFSDNYLNEKISKDNLTIPDIIHDVPQSKTVGIRQKTQQSIKDRNFNLKLKNYISMIDQTDRYEEQKIIKNEFIQTITELYEHEARLEIDNKISKKHSIQKSNINSMHQSINSYNSPIDMNLQSLRILKSDKQINIPNSPGRKGLNSLRFNQVRPKKVPSNDSDDISMISETEANLDLLYSQSQFIQQKVLQKDEKLNKLMKYFVKIEDIKWRVLKTNLKKLESQQTNNIFKIQ